MDERKKITNRRETSIKRESQKENPENLFSSHSLSQDSGRTRKGTKNVLLEKLFLSSLKEVRCQNSLLPMPCFSSRKRNTEKTLREEGST